MGIPLLVVVLALAVLTWSSRLTRLLVILFVLIVALAVGPRPIIGTKQLGTLPWAPLWSLPVARSAELGRLILLGYLVLAIILAVWLAAPSSSRLMLAARWILGLAAVAAIFANLLTASAVIVPRPVPRRRLSSRPMPSQVSSVPACTGTTCAQARSW